VRSRSAGRRRPDRAIDTAPRGWQASGVVTRCRFTGAPRLTDECADVPRSQDPRSYGETLGQVTRGTADSRRGS
jgi:hypothetical protein